MNIASRILVLCLICVISFSCARERDPIRIGINAWPGYEFLYLAQEKGFFEKEGVNVRIIEFNSLADGRRAYERGHLDGLACTLIEHIQILDRSDRSPKISLVVDYSNGADVILAKAGISTVQELAGTSIGLEIGSLGVFVLARALDIAGLDLADIQIKPLNQISIDSALCKGEIDAAISYPPASIKMQQSCGGSVIFSSAEIPDEIVDVVVLEESLIEARPSDAQAVVRAFFSAQAWAYQNPEEAFTLMGRREGLTGAEFKQALEDGIRIVKSGDQERFFAEGGALDKALSHCARVLRYTNQITDLSRIKQSIHRSGVDSSAAAATRPASR